MFERFFCILVFLGLASTIPNFSARSNICLYQTWKSLSMFFLTDLMFPITSSTIILASKISWSRFRSFDARALTSSRIFLVAIKTTTVWNDNKEAFSPWAFVIVSLSQFQLPVDDFKFGYSWGEMTASRKVTRSSYISRKRSRHVCLSTQRVLYRPGSLLWEFSGSYSFRVNSNSCCRFGLLFKNRYASLIRPIKFRTSDSLHDAAMERFRQWA